MNKKAKNMVKIETNGTVKGVTISPEKIDGRYTMSATYETGLYIHAILPPIGDDNHWVVSPIINDPDTVILMQETREQG